jgi:uncharacterized protein
MRELSEQAIRDIAYGSTVLGTGGGGDPYLGTLAAIHASRQHGPVKLVAAGELADDALVAFPFVVGAPLPFLEKLTIGPELVRVYRGLERFLGREVSAVMSAEVGGANSSLPMSLAAQLQVPVIDGDLIGRAFPEIQLTVLTLHGIAASPIVIGDEHGNLVTVQAGSNQWAERLARATAICFGAICVAIAYPLSGAAAKKLTLHGTISWAEQIGIALRLAREEKRDGLSAVREATGGELIFSGKIIDVERRTQSGWAVGRALLAGSDHDAGREMIVQFQNENLVAVSGGQIVASVPDLITILNAETGAAITTESLRYGTRVRVLAIACHPIWRTPQGLRLAGPAHWGFEHDYVPIAGSFPPADSFSWTVPTKYEEVA